MAAPALRRPAREHAIELAIEIFMKGERIDMGTLAARLGVGRTTLYRWVGDRERLIGEVLAILTERTWDLVIGERRRPGIEGGLETIRRFMEVTAAHPPLRTFAQTEPGPALRVLLAAEGPVAEALRRGSTRAMLAAIDEPVDPEPELTEVLVQLGTALEWGPIVAGEEPAIDRAVGLMRTVLEARYGKDARG